MARGPTVGVFARSGRTSQGKARFASVVDEWVQQTEKRINAVFRMSTQRMITIMQEAAPYRDGFLRASLVVVVNGDPPAPTRSEEQGMGDYNPAQMQMTISNAVAGDRIVAAYTMEYARRLEYGFSGVDSLGRHYNQPPIAWTRRTAQQWKQIVGEVTEEAKARVASRAQSSS